MALTNNFSVPIMLMPKFGEGIGIKDWRRKKKSREGQGSCGGGGFEHYYDKDGNKISYPEAERLGLIKPSNKEGKGAGAETQPRFGFYA